MKRKENESFEDYKARRKKAKETEKIANRGHLFWDSANKGTYRRPKKQSI